LLQQDRALAKQRAQERVEVAADLVTAALQRDLSELEQDLTHLANMSADGLARDSSEFSRHLPGNAVLLLISTDGVESLPADRLLFHPFLRPAKEPPPALFSAAEVLEFQRGDPNGAISALQQASRAADPQIRAAALNRIARNQRKSGRWEDAMRAYGELRALGSITVGGLPAELLARDAMCSLFEEHGDDARLKDEASALYADLGRGRWKVSEAAYVYYAGQARQRTGAAGDTRLDAVALSEAAQVLWGEWQRVAQGGPAGEGRRVQRLAGRPVLLAWRRSADRMAALAAGADFLGSAWLQALKPMLVDHGAALSLIDADGQPVWGNAPAVESRASVRLGSATRLPWMIHVSASDNPAESDSQVVRRRLLTAGFLLIVLVVISGGYFIGRAVTKEFQVARQQSDFVAAVSHEFRTPLTSLCQFTELLAKDRVESEEDRRRFYGVLDRESQRLRRLVEGLLNFGRMDAGVLDYRFETLDPAVLTRQVVAEFEEEGSARDHRIDCTADDPLPHVRVDREAFGCVIWNLVDNGVKYSPGRPTVFVRIGRSGDRVSISVRDEGVGVARVEQTAIFKKFTRGAAAGALHVRGTGIGLAMAHQIIDDHGGEIAVDSEPGRGSTFTVFLPVAEPS
jgi:signal transduction histidine kinase